MKHFTDAGCLSERQSLPVRGRGLKLARCNVAAENGGSLPVRGRGLKPDGYDCDIIGEGRSPCGGAD